MSVSKTREMVLCAIFSAIIAVMTVVPYTGYINYGIAIEITTLHIPVILGSILLGWKYGAVIGGVWGVTCLLRAFTNPLWVLFTNPLISVLPRVFVGIVAGAVFAYARKKGAKALFAAVTAALLATLTNTVLVLSAIYVFGGMMESYRVVFELFKTIFVTITTVNGALELGLAVVLTPALFTAVSRYDRKLRDN